MSLKRGMKLFDENGTFVGEVESSTDTHVVVHLASGESAARSGSVYEPVAGLVLVSYPTDAFTAQTGALITAALDRIDGVYYAALPGSSTMDDEPLPPPPGALAGDSTLEDDPFPQTIQHGVD